MHVQVGLFSTNLLFMQVTIDHEGFLLDFYEPAKALPRIPHVFAVVIPISYFLDISAARMPIL